jgi:hypothetical protein
LLDAAKDLADAVAAMTDAINTTHSAKKPVSNTELSEIRNELNVIKLKQIKSRTVDKWPLLLAANNLFHEIGKLHDVLAPAPKEKPDAKHTSAAPHLTSYLQKHSSIKVEAPGEAPDAKSRKDKH